MTEIVKKVSLPIGTIYYVKRANFEIGSQKNVEMMSLEANIQIKKQNLTSLKNVTKKHRSPTTKRVSLNSRIGIYLKPWIFEPCKKHPIRFYLTGCIYSCKTDLESKRMRFQSKYANIFRLFGWLWSTKIWNFLDKSSTFWNSLQNLSFFIYITWMPSHKIDMKSKRTEFLKQSQKLAIWLNLNL